MKTKLTLAIIVIIGFVVFISSKFLPAIDAPHNESNNVYCGSCHGQTVLDSSPFWGGTSSYDQLCLKCHLAPSGPYSDERAPLVQTHSSQNTTNTYGDWSIECTTCHDPHYQLQKNYSASDAINLSLVKGTISSCVYSPPDPEQGETIGKSTLTYNPSSIIYKSGWDAAELIDKTGKGGNDKRSSILFPNVKKLGYSYPIIAVDTPSANTITVKGNACAYIYPPTTFAAIYGQYIKNSIGVPDVMDIVTGNGEDGSITINTVKNLNTDIIAGGRSYPDGINWQITNSVSSGQATISSGISRPDGFAVGDEIIIINLKGTSTDYSGVGLYEFKTITALPFSNSITVDSNLTGSYDGTTQKIIVQRVPHYSNVTINTGGSITCNAWDGNKGGVVAFRASGTVTVNAPGGISTSGLGFHGGVGVAYNQNAGGGETYNGTGGAGGAYASSGQSGQGGGGGAGGYNGGSGAAGNTGGGSGGGGGTISGLPGSGGGGGYSSLGSGGAGGGDLGGNGTMGSGAIGGAGGNNTSGSYNGAGGGGGGIYGISDLYSRLYFGSGGGAGGGQNSGSQNGGNGGQGGGIVYISANTININTTGSIQSNGNNGANGSGGCSGSSAGGGGGAGGSVAVFAHQLNNSGSINANKGIGGLRVRCTSCFPAVCFYDSPQGGAGGGGRTYAAYYSFNGNYPTPSYSGRQVDPTGTVDSVKFYGDEGANSFADGSSYNSICEMCHTMTNHFRNSPGASDQNHTNLGDNIAGTNCMTCHPHCNGFFEATAGCLDCHSVQQGGRAAISSQFSGNSHHIQGVAVTNSQCYQCHWEANPDGSINNTYHEGYNPATQSSVSGAKVDLVIYGTGTRPTTYTVGTTAVQYTANGTRSEIKKINTHCLGCHNANNNTATPFGDGKTPKQYAWDGKSIDERYSQTGTTAWGKYSGGRFTPKNTQTKAYSAHGNATNNQGGWDLSETWPNTRNGSEIVACYDCHNSHGSTVSGTTTSYTSATTNGGILKDTVTGTGGYIVTYKPQAGGSTTNKNVYNAGAGICFDCHFTATSVTTPWGYNTTFGATQSIIGYTDTPYFGSGSAGPKQRFSYKVTPHSGGHFGVSSTLSSTPTQTINGLCTPCHDPHGVSPTLGANMQYSVPLLKGTWLTSLYLEDRAPQADVKYINKSGSTINIYHIDQNTFGSNITSYVTGITQTDSQFAGLCLNCHPKNTLTNGTTHTWKSKDRVHESVKGWKTADANIEHNYPCSKCHTPHSTSLPRLMVSNCLDSRHKGFNINNPGAITSGIGGGYPYTVTCDHVVCDSGGPYCVTDGCDVYGCRSSAGGHGSGRKPGNWSATCGSSKYVWSQTVTCHEHYASDQSWNNITQWSQGSTEITSGPFALPYAEDINISATITWTTNVASTSYVDYGLTSSYGSTTGNNSSVTSHSITLTGLTNYTTYHFRVRSFAGNEAVSGDKTVYVSLPPSVPVLQAQPDIVTTVPTPITLQWNASTNPGGGGPVQYYIEVDNDPGFSSPDFHLGWISGTSWTVTLPPGYWYWRVKARDANHIDSVSDWSSVDFFMTITALPAPTLIHEPDGALNTPITLEWNPVTSPDGDPLEYYVQWSTSPTFTISSNSGWISATSYSVTFTSTGTKYWRVKVRDSIQVDAVSPWSTDSFGIYQPPAAPTVVAQPDIVTTVPTAVTLHWNAVTSPDSDPVQYYVQVDNDPAYGSPDYTSGWVSGTSWSVTLPPGYWYWRVMARDAVHTVAVSGWSSSDFFMTMSPPDAPTLIPEPDVVSTVPVDVTLEWNPGLSPDGDPLQYSIQVNDSSSFFSPKYTSGWISGTSWTVTLPTAKTWYWRIQARDAVQPDAVSAWSTADSFNIFTSGAPPAPTLIHEPDNVVNVPVTLEWNPVTDPDSDPVQYYVCVSIWSDLSLCNYNSGWISGTSYSITFTTARTYYWKVQARDATHTDAVSPWSTADSFGIYQPPAAPTVVAQPDIVTTVPTAVTLHWNAVTSPDSDPVQYYVQVDNDPAYGSPDYTSGWVSGTSWSVTLPPGYWYWRVMARDAVHTVAVSGWSSSDFFMTMSPPDAPTLIPEPDVVSTVPAAVTLEWDSAALSPDGDPLQYDVQVDDQCLFFTSPNTIDYESGWISGTSWTVTLATPKRWCWRVQARDAIQTAAVSAWPTADSFNIFTSNPPPAPTLIHEPDNVVNVPVTLEWNPVTDPDSDPVQYYVCVSSWSDLSVCNYYYSGWISGTSYSITFTTARTYYWGVQARDATHTDAVSPWSTTDSFVIH